MIRISSREKPILADRSDVRTTAECWATSRFLARAAGLMVPSFTETEKTAGELGHGG